MLKKKYLRIALCLLMVRQVRHIRFSFKHVFLEWHTFKSFLSNLKKKSLNVDRFYIQVHLNDLKIAVHLKIYRKLYVFILLKVRIKINYFTVT